MYYVIRLLEPWTDYVLGEFEDATDLQKYVSDALGVRCEIVSVHHTQEAAEWLLMQLTVSARGEN